MATHKLALIYFIIVDIYITLLMWLLLLSKAPIKMRNSTIKLQIPSELILAKVEEKKMMGRFSMALTKPS